MPIVTHDGQETFIEVLVCCGIVEGSVGNAVEEGEVGGGVFFGSCFSGLNQQLASFIMAEEERQDSQELQKIRRRIKRRLESNINRWTRACEPSQSSRSSDQRCDGHHCNSVQLIQFKK